MNKTNYCPLSQERKGNWILKRLGLEQASKDSCWELAGGWKVNIHLSIRSFLLHLSAFMLSHHCNAQHNPVRNKPQRTQQGWAPVWEKTPCGLSVRGGCRRCSSSETWCLAKLRLRAERHQALVPSKGQTVWARRSKKGATKEMWKGEGEKLKGRGGRKFCRMDV